MAMSNTQKWVGGVLLLGIAVVAVVILTSAKGKDKNPPVTTTTLPPYCDPYKPGYDKDGRPDPFCGKPLPGYLSECDPNHPGYDVYGFADAVNCGFGRIKK